MTCSLSHPTSMNRRDITKALAISAAASGLGSASSVQKTKPPQLAITMDDFTWSGDAVRLTGEERNQAILETLRAHSLKAALFVRASNIDDDKGKTLLECWDSAGHLIGNHSYSHWYYNSKRITAEAFEQDIIRGEDLLRVFPQFKRIFRFPYLKEGDTLAKRDAIRSFLTTHGY